MMVSFFRLLFALSTVIASPAMAVDQASPDLRFFSIGTGEVTGNYYAAAKAICGAVNRHSDGTIRCSAEATQGTIYNLAALKAGDLDFAIVQSDWLRYAYQGAGIFEAEGPMTELRTVMALYPETLTILAARGRGIDSLLALRGHRIDIGAPASGRHATALRVLDAVGLSSNDFPVVLELPITSAYEELCAGRIDASILVIGHPNEGLASAISRCNLEIVGISAPTSEDILSRHPDFRAISIPASDYGLAADIPSLAVTATVITLAAQPDDLVRTLVEQTRAALPELRIAAPIFGAVEASGMGKGAEVAPLHPGAAAAYEALPP
ncbi:hypothetical protein CG51_01555 [Haematobacter missouriensis]|uniref:C4-dicarboxylate ABC transporter substrate-binding protein n=2 Tax=Haematobacter missouriensis TaxID=366616 RepID=A0A212AHI5_9RHOB|nr:hypothetical protein CG51_01555 [Haematobacter missouriensis]OWJ76517.1 hypothetical protein CDV53_08330 [Haematobacter missouriensis]OWJ80962.1 hypothetical protein CDV52_20260 [Haematobacter missouriensis]